MNPSFAFWPRTSRVACLSLALCTFDTITRPIAAQSSEPPVTAQSLERARTMLKQIKKDLYENYYDSTFHGLDMSGQFRQAPWDASRRRQPRGSRREIVAMAKLRKASA